MVDTKEKIQVDVYLGGLPIRENRWWPSTVHVSYKGLNKEEYGYVGKDYFLVDRSDIKSHVKVLTFSLQVEKVSTIALQIKIYRLVTARRGGRPYYFTGGKHLETKRLNVPFTLPAKGLSKVLSIYILSTGESFEATTSSLSITK